MINGLLKWFSYTKLWMWFAATVVSNLGFRIWKYPTFPMEKYFEILKVIKNDECQNGPGIYVFVSCDEMAFSTILIRKVSRCYWTHAGFVTMQGERVIHQRSVGNLRQHILELLREVDSFAVGRVEMDSLGVKLVRMKQEYIESHPEEFPYDLQHELGGKTFDCSELVFTLCKEYATAPKFQAHEELGRMIFEPEDLYAAMKIIFEHRKGQPCPTSVSPKGPT